MNMAEVWGMVEVTPSDAVIILNALAESNADRSSTLVASLHAAIEQVLTPTPPVTQEASSEPTTSY